MGGGLYGARGTVVPEDATPSSECGLDPDGFIIWDWEGSEAEASLLATDENTAELPLPSGFFRLALRELRKGARYRLTLSQKLCDRLRAQHSTSGTLEHPSSNRSRIYLLESIEPSCLYLRDELRDHIYYMEYELLFGPDVTLTLEYTTP